MATRKARITKKEASRIATIRWQEVRKNKAKKLSKKIMPILVSPDTNEVKAVTIARQIVDKKLK